MTIKRIEHYNTLEIIDKFKELHEYAMGCLEHVKATGRERTDEADYAWEKVMKLLGDDIFKTYNNYLE